MLGAYSRIPSHDMSLVLGGSPQLSGPAAQKIVTAGIASFLTGGVKNLVTGGHGNGGLKVACPTGELI